MTVAAAPVAAAPAAGTLLACARSPGTASTVDAAEEKRKEWYYSFIRSFDQPVVLILSVLAVQQCLLLLLIPLSCRTRPGRSPAAGLLSLEGPLARHARPVVGWAGGTSKGGLCMLR